MECESVAPRDLTVLPERLRDAAVPIGPDFVWPVEVAGEVIQALAGAGAVIRAIEAWMIDEEGVPAVVGWSDYDLEDSGDDRVAAVAAALAGAEDALAGVLEGTTRDEVSHVGIDWDAGFRTVA